MSWTHSLCNHHVRSPHFCVYAVAAENTILNFFSGASTTAFSAPFGGPLPRNRRRESWILSTVSSEFPAPFPFRSFTMPRLVRRRPLAERIKSYLNPLDFLLWVSEEIDTHDWDQFEKDWALSAGIALNAVFLIARANSRSNASRITDDVFGDDGGVPWLSWFVCLQGALCYALPALGCAKLHWTHG